jgi:hypothetical protein
VTGSLNTSGGRGGKGGNGGSGYGAIPGASAAAGGNAGAISLTVRNFSATGSNATICNDTGYVMAEGGIGGEGGDGGRWYPGRMYKLDCEGHVCYDFCIPPGVGEVGGYGGHGGNGGAITILATTDFLVSDHGSISSKGGNGGRAGRAGDGSGDRCFASVGCPEVASAGPSRTSADGGYAGIIRLQGGSTLTNNGSVSSHGGLGGDGQPGANPGNGCCCALIGASWSAMDKASSWRRR